MLSMPQDMQGSKMKRAQSITQLQPFHPLLCHFLL